MPIHPRLLKGSAYGLDGNQILHTSPNDRPHQLDPRAIEFVQTTLKQALALETDAEVLRYASDQVIVDGLFVELGTYEGKTANFLAALNPRKVIYTFDAYQGLPINWDRGNVLISGQAFAWPEGKERPLLLPNVELREGWFIDTLPPFVELYDEEIAFLHVDCDIYESTAQSLSILGPRIADGTVILFDDFYNYPNYRNHEYKAFQEFLESHSFKVEYLAYNSLHEQVAVRLQRMSG